jgi:hypothetical protein
MPVTSWRSTPALNTLDSGTAGSGGTITLDGSVQLPSQVDDVQRSHMAQIASFNAAPTFTGPITISGASAGQIVFPASQNASANANTLDDYEEGTLTVGVAFGGAAVGVAYLTRVAKYTKVGNQVTFLIDIVLSNKGSSVGGFTITGLPFTSSGIISVHSVAIGLYSGFTGLTGALYAGIVGGSDAVSIFQSSATALAAVADTAVTNSTNISVGGTYLV